MSISKKKKEEIIIQALRHNCDLDGDAVIYRGHWYYVHLITGIVRYKRALKYADENFIKKYPIVCFPFHPLMDEEECIRINKKLKRLRKHKYTSRT